MNILLLALAIVLAVAIILVLLFNFSPAFKRTFGKYFYNWLYGLKWGQARTNNYGYGPASPEAQAYSKDEQFQLQLYRELSLSIGEAAWRGKVVLEVGCGRGGGLHFLHRLLGTAHTHGLDFSHNAIRACQEGYAADKERLHFVQGDALSLPYDGGLMDIVFNVESSHIYSDQAQFLREVARVLKPGGLFIIADYRALRDALQRFRDEVKAAGLEPVSERDISQEVLAACKGDSARRESLILGAAPAFARNYLREFAMTDQSREFLHFQERYLYFIMVFRKPG